MLGSLRIHQQGQLKIGRQQIQKNGQRPNDIMLQSKDLGISRSHCKINYKNGFSNSQSPIQSKNFLQFLRIFYISSQSSFINTSQAEQILSNTSQSTNKNLSSKSHSRNQNIFQIMNQELMKINQQGKLPCLPIQIRKMIWDYFMEPSKFWIVDLGSICGTFLKLSGLRAQEIRKGQSLLLGAQIHLLIEDIWDGNQIDFGDLWFDNNLKYLARQTRDNSQCKVMGITQQQNDILIAASLNPQNLDQTQLINQGISVPAVKISILSQIHHAKSLQN